MLVSIVSNHNAFQGVKEVLVVLSKKAINRITVGVCVFVVVAIWAIIRSWVATLVIVGVALVFSHVWSVVLPNFIHRQLQRRMWSREKAR